MRKGTRRWILGSVVLSLCFVGVCGLRGCTPEAKLATHLDQLSRLMEKHVRSPRGAVTRFFDYNQEHLSEMLGLWGDILATLDRIENDKSREARGRRLVATLRPSLQRFGETSQRFFEAVQRDPEARQELERRLARLRPLEDLFQALSRLTRQLVLLR